MEDDYKISNMMNEEVMISLSKKKTLLALIGAVIFVVIGYFMTTNPKFFISPVCRSPDIIRISGVASVVFFGLCLFFIAQKLFDNRPGLIIDQNGITNNTNAIHMGLIDWSDITEIEVKQVMSTKFLILHTKNPEKYIDRTKNVIAKQAMNLNYKNYGSPISIISNSLNIDFQDLEKVIRSKFEERKKYRQ